MLIIEFTKTFKKSYKFEKSLLRELKRTKRLAKKGKISVYDTDEKFYEYLADGYGYEPNEKTIQAMKECEEGKNSTRYNSYQDFLKEFKN